MKFYYKTLTSLFILEHSLLQHGCQVNGFSTPKQLTTLSHSSMTTRSSLMYSQSPHFHPSSTNHVVINHSNQNKKALFKTILQMSTSSSTATTLDNQEEQSLFEPIGKGIIRDYKARLPLYTSDIKDGLNTQSLAATLFLFFACLAPAVGFGGLFAVATQGAIGTIEMVSSTAGMSFIILFWFIILLFVMKVDPVSLIIYSLSFCM